MHTKNYIFTIALCLATSASAMEWEDENAIVPVERKVQGAAAIQPMRQAIIVLQHNAEAPSVNGRQEIPFVKLTKIRTNRVFPPVLLNKAEGHDLSASDLNAPEIKPHQASNQTPTPQDVNDIPGMFDANMDLFFVRQEKDKILKELVDKEDKYISDRTVIHLVTNTDDDVDTFRQFVEVMLLEARAGNGIGLSMGFCKDSYFRWKVAQLKNRDQASLPIDENKKQGGENKNKAVMKYDKLLPMLLPYISGGALALGAAGAIGYTMRQGPILPVPPIIDAIQTGAEVVPPSPVFIIIQPPRPWEIPTTTTKYSGDIFDAISNFFGTKETIIFALGASSGTKTKALLATGIAAFHGIKEMDKGNPNCTII